MHSQVNAASLTDEASPRYMLARRLIGVTTLHDYLRSLAGGVLWFGLPPLVSRMLARSGHPRASQSLLRWWARGLRRFLRIRLDIAGLEYIDPSRSYIVTPLHEGFADVIALLHLPFDMRFVVRDELFTWRVLGPYLRDTGQIAVTPERGQWSYRQLLRQAAHVVATGESVVIFPQGTILGIETDFLRGAFALAHVLKCPILPVALTGGHRVWEHPYTPRLRFGQRMSLRVFPPVAVNARRHADIDQIRIMVRRHLKDAALGGGMAPPRRFVPERDGYWDGYAYHIDPDFPELAAQIDQHRRSRS
jgi:1-acyl-sn-glycerol-3-phosphate acyltransferase